MIAESRYGFDCNYCGNCFITGGAGFSRLDRYSVYCMSPVNKGGARKIGERLYWDGHRPEWCPQKTNENGGL